MKTSLTIASFVLAIAVVLVAGCTTLGSSSGSTPTPTAAPTAVPTATSSSSGNQNPGSPSPTSVIAKLTDAQKTQAENIASANATISSALASGYALDQVNIYDPTIPTASIVYMKNSNAELDEYIVIVSLNNNTINSVAFSQHMYPTPAPTAPLQ
jgi:hypothetical protein